MTSDYPQPARSGLARLVPLAAWLPGYHRGTLRHDLVAGLTVAVMLVPQSMAYAVLAGLPPQAGLYASVVPLLVYALLGSSGSLAVGPVAITALLTGAALAPLADGDPVRYAGLAAALALLVGAVQLLLGLLRLGALVSLLSHSVLVGFTGAAAVVIAVSQLPALLGVTAGRSDSLPGAVRSLAPSLSGLHWPTLAVAVGSLGALLVLRRVARRLPGPLIVVAAVTAISAGWGLAGAGVSVLGPVPAGLPAPELPRLGAEDLVALLPAAVAIGLISYLEGIAVAKALAAKAGQPIRPTQELIAVGAANLSAGVWQAFPVAGGFSRSAVNFAAGSRTPWAGVVAALLVALTAVLLTPAFAQLPQAVLAAIVVVAVAGLIDYREAGRVWRTRRLDGITVALTFVVTLGFGVEPGLAVGVLFSLAVFVARSARPHIAELGRRAGTTSYRNTARYPDLVTDPEVLVVRVDGPLYFANAELVTSQVQQLAQARPELRSVVLDASGIGDIDADGVDALRRLRYRLADRSVTLRLATVRGPVRDVLDRAGLWRELTTAGAIHPEIAAAVTAGEGTAAEP
ncbi:sulfate permease [Natronosporangium hydrolyticum]|uniref:Sulfate permease n=1 Tax=Natronosporangium hydrolyticum TaxID=2811111 RepID=A0A895Y647_9ACTN|nr:sulfate permease [Natronosporangium hydrolyticum]QSB13204.1 sulfate permease [Natronosporangium hydrolyticum]